MLKKWQSLQATCATLILQVLLSIVLWFSAITSVSFVKVLLSDIQLYEKQAKGNSSCGMQWPADKTKCTEQPLAVTGYNCESLQQQFGAPQSIYVHPKTEMIYHTVISKLWIYLFKAQILESLSTHVKNHITYSHWQSLCTTIKTPVHLPGAVLLAWLH